MRSIKPIIYGAIGVGSLVTSIIFAIKDAKKEDPEEPEQDISKETTEPETKTDSVKKLVKKVTKPVKKYWKTIAFASLSILCFFSMYGFAVKSAAAAMTAYEVTKEGFDRYYKKTEDLYGPNAAEKIERRAMKSFVEDLDPEKDEIVETGAGNTIFYDVISHTSFRSSFDRIRRIERDLNASLDSKRFVPLSAFYKRAGITLDKKWIGESLGWNKEDGPIAFEYYPQALKNGERAAVIGYHVAPHYNYKQII